MSTFNLAKTLKPARKSWKSLKNHLQSKLLNHPNFLNSIKTFRQRCNAAWKSISPNFLHQKFLSLTKRSPPHPCRHLHHRRCHFQLSNSAIYVDKLFPGPISLAKPGKAEGNMDGLFPGPVNKFGPGSVLESHNSDKIQTRRVDKVSFKIPGNDEKALDKGKAEAGESSKSSSAEKWKIDSVPQIRGIDERAEEFIAKFRQDMKLEREQSILEFEDMLKRSA